MRDPARDPERPDERVCQEPIIAPPIEERDDLDPGRGAVERLQQTAGNSAVCQAVAPTSHGAARRVAEALVPGLGRPLEPHVRREMEGYLRRDLRGVRVHTDGAAARVARGLGARAFTAGNNVVFAEGAYAPGTTNGREILVHELTHVVQQGGVRGAGRGGAGVVDARAAEDVARRSGRAVRSGVPSPEAPREAPAAVLQGDVEEAIRREWESLADLFESDEEVPGPVVLAEGLATTAIRIRKVLDDAGALSDDSGAQGRMRRVGEELERAEREIPELVAEVDVNRLAEIHDALEEMCEGLEKVEQIPHPAEQRPRAVSELTRVTKAAGRLEAALPNGTWRSRMKGLADLGPLIAQLREAPEAAAGGGDGDDDDAKPEAA